MKILHASNYKQVPWKNGDGQTREVFVKWCDESQTTWDWRISIADVVRSGPFSIFNGVDRSIAVLDGRGLKLNFSSDNSVKLNQSSEPFVFAGDVDVRCETLGGASTDLNVMTMRKSFRHSLRKLHLIETTSINFQAGWNALIANTALALCHEGRQLGLQRLDAVMDIGNVVEVTPVTKGDVFIVNVIGI
jgi:uncharacterized protein